ncbi:MAG: hypothetical protein HFF86_09325 [Oscillibacter sp.]|nr:hypothetical protein [Oscillibacter sp.]
MPVPQRALFFFEEDASIPSGGKPLALQPLLSRPVLEWMSRSLLGQGVKAFFVVCGPRFAAEAEACFPEGSTVSVSELHSDLAAFLDTEETVLVLPRAAAPLPEAGPGFAYTAAGHALARAWKERMTNNVQEAELASGWVPLFGPETIAELEPLLKQRGFAAPAE